MLPSRGLTRQPASALLRYSISSRINPTRTISTRQFSQAPSQSSLLPRQRLSQTSTTRYGPSTPGIAPSVFAQRAGAARNLSLWPFQSKPKDLPAVETPSEWSEPPPPPVEVQPPPVVEEPTMSTAAEPTTNTTFPPADEPLSDDFLREFDPQSLLDIPERIGFLKELGLDFGLGPTACCEWLLEHIHVYTGMPWWASIAAVSLLFRAAMFFPTLSSTRQQAKLQKLRATPAFAKAEADMKEAAYRTRDQNAMLVARAEMSRLKKAAGHSWLKSFAGLAMFPFSYGMFRLLRGMASLPVPGLETGGLAWFTDLSVYDPFYILPCVSAALTTLMFKQSRAANMQPDDELLGSVSKIMTWAMPPLMFVGTAWLASGIQWFFLVLTVGTLAQTQATLYPSFRRWANLPPLPVRPNPAAQGIVTGVQYQSPTPGGIRTSLQGSVENATKTLKTATGATDEKARWKKVQEYEDQRAEEERQKAARRLEEARRRRAGRQ